VNGKWTVGRKIALGFALAILVLVVVGGVAYRTDGTLIENAHAVTRTHQAIESLTHLVSLMKDAETGARGFALTGDESYLEPFNAAVAELGGTLENVRTQTRDDPRQQERAARLGPLVDVKLAELRQTIDARRAGNVDAAIKVVVASDGKRKMDDIRSLVGEMTQEEHTVLDARAAAAEEGVSATKTTIIGGVVLALVAVVTAAWIITSSLGRQLSSAVSSIRSSSAELQAAASQQASGSREQSSAATEVSTTIRELLSTSRQIAESSQRVARIAEETAGSAKAGDESVVRARDSMTSIKRQVDLIVGHMLDLGKKSQQAGSILEIINELAEQTNILAINATIEAAGAGESGKRFAVVADEIRKLADRVGGSTKEIRTLIDDIRAAVNTTVMATESGVKAVESGAKQFSDVTVAFGQIAGLVGTTTDAAREIELSTKQQATAVEQVNVAIANVAQATKESEASSTQTLQTATQLTTLSEELMRLVRQEAA